MVSTLHALDDREPRTFLYQTSDNPFGISYKEWTERWWQWFVGIPNNSHPADDPSGAFAHTNQAHNNVFFLAGAVNRRAVRTLNNISSDKALLLPILVVENSELEWPGSPIGDLQKLSQGYSDDMISLKATINQGTPEEIRLWTGELSKYRVCSNEFKLTFQKQNLFTHVGGQDKIIF